MKGRVITDMGLLRAKAEIAGSSRFFTGKPCRNGHVAERYVSNGICVECSKIKYGLWRSLNRDLANLRTRIYRSGLIDA